MSWTYIIITFVGSLIISISTGILYIFLFKVILFNGSESEKEIKNKIPKQTKKMIKYFKKIEKILYSMNPDVRPDSLSLDAIYENLYSKNLLR